MVKKSSHPDIKLFDYLNDSVDGNTRQEIEEHLSTCDECANLAKLVRAIKSTAESASGDSDAGPPAAFDSHPSTKALASFFYAKSELPEHAEIAGHIALCRSCVEAIAQYAHAEQLATNYSYAGKLENAPAKAWEMIREWEESSFAKPKPASEVLGRKFLDRVATLLNKAEITSGSQQETAERVPVLVLTSSAEMRGVEFFEPSVDSKGTDILRHAEGSERYDNKPVHALFDLGDDSFVVSNVIKRDTIRIERAKPEESKHTAYIIIED
jgi:hypothetical protein